MKARKPGSKAPNSKAARKVDSQPPDPMTNPSEPAKTSKKHVRVDDGEGDGKDGKRRKRSKE
jgi:hypothetical protein